MSDVLKKWWFWVTIIVLLLLIAYLRSEGVIKIANGGYLDGKAHEQGGVNGVIKINGQRVELEGGEVVIDKNSISITDRYRCEGTPKDIASALNEMGGSGNKFGNGNCIKV